MSTVLRKSFLHANLSAEKRSVRSMRHRRAAPPVRDLRPKSRGRRMSLHRLSSVTVGVPNLALTSRYYSEFGLTPLGDGHFATQDGGDQLHLVHSPRRRLVEVSIGADDRDDIDRISRQLEAMG